METVTLLYEDYQKELAEDFKNTFLKRASDTDSSRSNDTVIDEVTDMLSTNIAVYTEKLLQRWGFSSGGEGGGGGDVTVTLDDLLKKYLSDNYVTIKGDQEVFGEKDFRKGIRIAGRRLYWDEGNDALVIEGAAYTTRWLSAKGVSPGGGGAGSGGAAAMYQLIDVSPNDTKDAVLGAEKDYVLTFDGSFWRGMPNKGGLSSKLFTALDKEGNEVNPDDENAEIYAIRANYSLWSVGFLSAKGISDGGTGGGGGGAVALYQLLDVEKNADITGVAGATKGSVLTFNGDKWYADKPKTAAGISNLFTALDKDGNEVDLNDESKLGTITNIRANYALWSVDWISAKGKSSGGSGGGGGLINLVYGFESLGGTFDNNDNSATFNAFTINEIWKLASSGLTNVTVTGSGNAVTDVTKGSDGRSLTFTKGSTFATKSEFDALNTKFNDFLTGSDADDIINKWSELEVFLQGMKESDNLAVILQSKMDKTAFSKLFTALDASGNEVDPSDSTKTIASIRANFGFWGVDYISAKGVSKGSGGTGGASTLYQLVDVLANDTEDGVEGAAAGKALVFDGTHWRAGDAGLNESQLYSYLTANKYLTQSAADSRYVTSSRKVIAGTGLSGGGALTSDVTLSLGTSGVVAGTYTKVIVDAYGRVTSGTNLSATDIPNLDWSKINTGKPTTLAGYGITDAYTKTEADGKYVTIATAQTVSGAKTFSATMKTASVLPRTDANSALGGTANRWSNVYSVKGVFSQNVTAKLLSASESLQIGDAYLKWDAANNAVYVVKKDGTTPVGFYSTDWLSAKGVSKGSGGTGGASTLYQLVDVLANDTEDGVEGAAAGKALVFDGTHWRAGDAGLNESQLYSYLTANKYLTQSAADSRYVTSSRKVIAGTGLSGGGALTSDVTLSLGTSGVVAGTYTKVIVDAYGRVTSGTNLSATDIPNLDWSKINTGKPTTLAGYGITDAYTKTEADGKYVTIATAQTVSGAKTFSATMKTASVLPRTDANSALGGTANRWSNVYSVKGVFSQNVTAKLLSASESLQIGDAYLKWDAANNAVYVVKKDGTTPVGFYSTDWLSAKGVSISGVQTGTLAALNDVEITDPTNGQALKYDAASKKWVNGTIDSFNVNQMWAELKKADSSKIIDASHIPTSVLDGRWVTLSTNQTITGQKTFTQNILFSNNITGIRNTAGNLVFGAGNENIFCILNDYVGPVEAKNNQLVLGNDVGYWKKVTAGQYISKVATGVSPLIVSSNTLVNNLNSNYLEGYNNLGFIHSNYSASTGGTAYVSGDTHIMLVAEINIDTIYSTYVILLSNEFWGHQHYSALQLHIACTNNDNSGNKSPRCSVHVMSLVGSHARGVRYKIENNKAYIFIEVYGGNSYGRWASTILQNYDSITTNNANTTGNIKLKFAFNQANSGLTAASYDNYINAASLAASRTLWGQPFNGTANVSGNMTGVGSITMSGQLTSTVASGVAPFIVTSNTVVGNLNADLLDGFHENSFLRSHGVASGDGASTLWSQIGILNFHGAYPDGVTLKKYAYGAVVSMSSGHSRFDLYSNHKSSSSDDPSNGIQYRSGWGTDKRPWRMLLDNVNYASYSDGRYVKKAGDTMTGDLAMDTNKGFYIPHRTRVVKTSGNWIHGGADVASSTDANLRFASWYGIGWYPTIDSTSGVRQGNNAMWLNVRTGVLDVHSNITSHNGYLAANWDSARRLVLGGGSYSWIDSRDSSNNVLCKIVLQDNKVTIGNYAESSRFVSTVGTGTAPYQCSSTTLNTNLNADMLDNWHIMDIPRNYNSTATYSLQFALGGTDNGWKKIFACSESGAGPYRSVTVWGRIWYAYGNHAQNEVRSYHFCAIFQMRSEPSASDSNVGDISNSARLYLPTFAKGMDNIRLVRVGTNNFELQVRQIRSYNNGYIQYQYWAKGANVSAWRGLQSTSNTSVAVSAGGASTLADSRASSADVWTSARTFYIQDHNASHTGAGISVNGSSNVYLKLPNSIQCSDWFRSTGNSGWYHQDYGGGIYMQDGTWVRVYGGKRFYVSNADNSDFSTATAISTEGGIYARKNITSSANIFANGAITAKASSSDIRLKTDIQGYDAMGIIRKFRSVKYHWNAIAKENSEVFNHDNWNYGLIAQDLLSGGYTQWVKDAFNDYYTIDYERLIPVVWKGLQEVDDEVTKLKREVARLNKRVKELEKSLCA